MANGTEINMKGLLDAPLSASGLTTENCSIVSGGYAQVGNFVIVNIRVANDTSSNYRYIRGFPSYAGGYNRISCMTFDYDTNEIVRAALLDDGVLSIYNVHASSGQFVSTIYAIY